MDGLKAADAAPTASVKPYAAFVSHYKAEAAMEARFLTAELETALGRNVFLDSDDLHNLRKLKEAVIQSDVLILLQSARVLERPWCLIELATALDHGVPIVGVSLTTGHAPYNFSDATNFLLTLETTLAERNPGAAGVLAENDVALEDLSWKLSSTLPAIISIGFNPSASKAVLGGTTSDIVDAVRKGAVVEMSSKDEWLRRRAKVSESIKQTSTPARSEVSAMLYASIPPEVPTLPESSVDRPDIIAALKDSVLKIGTAGANTATVSAPARKPGLSQQSAGASTNTTTAAGMGGVGKTMMAAALVRDNEVRAGFDKICWVSVGQEPDTMALQNTLYKQLVMKPLPETAKDDMQLALQELKHAAKNMSVLLVLDDVWVASHATPLNFIDGSASRSAVIVTTRIRSLLDGAAEVQCGTLSMEASLELLLRAGGCEHLLEAPPPAAREAVELCGRLPLALGIAGGIIEGLGTTWQAELCELLKEEFEEASVEERVVTASLRAVPEAMREGVEALFTLFAIFPEDAIVPDTAIDVVAPLIPQEAAKKKMHVRRWLQQLLKANILRGSIEDGVSVHDLVRDCMIRRAESAREGGLRATQREVVALLLAAFDARGPAASYVSASLHWHVRQAQQADLVIYIDDAVMVSVLRHQKAEIRKQGAIGIGVDKLSTAADECDKSGEHLNAAQLMWAACAVRGQAAGAELRRAWASIKLLEAAGCSSSASRALESGVLNMLMIAVNGGFAFGSKDHNDLMERVKDLASMQRTVEVDMQANGAALPSKELMDIEFGLGFAAFLSALGSENITGYSGPVTYERVVQTHGFLDDSIKHLLQATTVAPDDASAIGMRSQVEVSQMFLPRRHALAGFDPIARFSEGGLRLRETIERCTADLTLPV